MVTMEKLLWDALKPVAGIFGSGAKDMREKASNCLMILLGWC